jgi:hypothetical protein
VLSALNHAYLISNDFFVALDHHVQVQMPAPRMLQLVSTLRESLRSAENRGRLAALEGVLRLYADENASSLSPRDLHASAVVGAFADLLQDELYQALTARSYVLGLPVRAKAALTDMKRLAWISTEGSFPNIGGFEGAQVVKRSVRPFHQGTVTV